MRTPLVAFLPANPLAGPAVGDDVVTISSLPWDYDAVEIRTEIPKHFRRCNVNFPVIRNREFFR